MVNENIDFTKFCDECKNLEMPEKMQEEVYKNKCYRPAHWCKKYSAQVLHLGMAPKILRCGICLDNNGFEEK